MAHSDNGAVEKIPPIRPFTLKSLANLGEQGSVLQRVL
jgi:hypothetical protein